MGPKHTLQHWVRFIRRLFQSNNFVDPRQLADVCAVLNVILVLLIGRLLVT